MADVNTALAILSGQGNSSAGLPPPAYEAAPVAPISPADRALAILNGKGAPAANDGGALLPAVDGAPGSVFTSDPNLPGSELRPMQGNDYASVGASAPPPMLGGGFRGSGAALQPGGTPGSPSRSF